MSGIKILTPEEAAQRPHRILQEISSGQLCGNDGQVASVENGRELLRAEAAQLGADGVTNVLCGQGGTTGTCWSTLECRGDAIAFTEAPAPAAAPAASTTTP